MATVEQCEQALQALADRLAANDSPSQAGFDRSLTCTISDLGVMFGARLKDGKLIDIAPAGSGQAQIKLTMSGDDLLALVEGRLKMSSAWATGRVKVDAGVRDLLKLRSIF